MTTTRTLVAAVRPMAFQRVRFFDGMILTAEDLEAEREYHLARSRLVNRAVFGCGIACGLTVEKAETDERATRVVCVRPGIAFDCRGDPLELCRALKLDLDPEACKAPPTRVCILIRRRDSGDGRSERECDPCAGASTEGPSRTREEIEVSVVDSRTVDWGEVCHTPSLERRGYGYGYGREQAPEALDPCTCLKECETCDDCGKNWVLLACVELEAEGDARAQDRDSWRIAAIDLTGRRYIKPIRCLCSPEPRPETERPGRQPGSYPGEQPAYSPPGMAPSSVRTPDPYGRGSEPMTYRQPDSSSGGRPEPYAPTSEREPSGYRTSRQERYPREQGEGYAGATPERYSPQPGREPPGYRPPREGPYPGGEREPYTGATPEPYARPPEDEPPAFRPRRQQPYSRGEGEPYTSAPPEAYSPPPEREPPGYRPPRQQPYPRGEGEPYAGATPEPYLLPPEGEPPDDRPPRQEPYPRGEGEPYTGATPEPHLLPPEGEPPAYRPPRQPPGGEDDAYAGGTPEPYPPSEERRTRGTPGRRGSARTGDEPREPWGPAPDAIDPESPDAPSGRDRRPRRRS
jgi:hypothetical protein